MTTPAGWYSDPGGSGNLRYWDGAQWTEHLAPAVSTHGAADYAPLHEPATSSRRGGWPLVGGGIAAVMVVIAGVFGLSKLTAASGGADSPEAAVDALFEAIGNEDLVGVADILLPGERRSLAQPLLDTLDELVRLDILSSALDTSSVGGIEFEFDDLSFDVDQVTDDIANVYSSGTVIARLDGRDLPVGDRLLRLIGNPDMGEVQEGPDTEAFRDMRLTTVRESGRWYVSLLYTAAEAARISSASLPIAAGDGIAPRGESTPQEALDAYLDDLAALDVRGLIARLDPTEAAALQRYAPLFVPQAQAAADEAEVEISVLDAEWRIDQRGDVAHAYLESFDITVAVTNPYYGREEYSFSYADGCYTVLVDSESDQWDDEFYEPYPMFGPGFEVNEDGSVTVCQDDAPADLWFGFGLPPFPTMPEIDETGLVLTRHGGSWYISPIASMTTAWLELLRGIDGQTIDDIVAWFEEVGSGSYWYDEAYGEAYEEAFVPVPQRVA